MHTCQDLYKLIETTIAYIRFLGINGNIIPALRLLDIMDENAISIYEQASENPRNREIFAGSWPVSFFFFDLDPKESGDLKRRMERLAEDIDRLRACFQLTYEYIFKSSRISIKNQLGQDGIFLGQGALVAIIDGNFIVSDFRIINKRKNGRHFHVLNYNDLDYRSFRLNIQQSEISELSKEYLMMVFVNSDACSDICTLLNIAARKYLNRFQAAVKNDYIDPCFKNK